MKMKQHLCTITLLLTWCSSCTGQSQFKNLVLDAVQWISGFWKQPYNHLHHVLILGTIDGSCLVDGNGANFNNFRRAAGVDNTPYVKVALLNYTTSWPNHCDRLFAICDHFQTQF